MSGKLNIFDFGDLGVDLVHSPLHIPDGAWQLAQNAEFSMSGGQGGIKKRGGMVKLTGSAMTGAVQCIEGAPFPLPGASYLMLGLNSGETNAWKQSVDGSVFTNIASATLQRLAASFTSLWGGTTIPRDPRAVTYGALMYFVGDDYVVDTTAPPLVKWDGTSQYELFNVPNNPTSTGVTKWISDCFIADGFIYLCTYDPSGVAPNHKGRVLRFDPVNGTLVQIGNRFGNGTGENTAGFPFCFTKWLGSLWVGTYGVSGNNQGKVYRLLPNIDESWTLDTTGTLHNGYYMSLCPYKGNLYMATDADNLGTAIIQKRTPTAVVTTSLTAPAGNTAFFCSMIVFNGTLFAGYHNSATPKTLIKAFDNSSWSTDKDVTVDLGSSLVPGKPCIFQGALYWPFYSLTSDSTTTGYLLKRTTAGVWSTVASGIGIRGGLCYFLPTT